MTANAIAPATRSSIRLVNRYFPRDKRQEALHITAEPNARHEASQCRFREGVSSTDGRRSAAAAVHRCEDAEIYPTRIVLDAVGGLYDGEEWEVDVDEFGGAMVHLDDGESLMVGWGLVLDEFEERYAPDGPSSPLDGLTFVRYTDEDGDDRLRIEHDWDSSGNPVTYREYSVYWR